MPTGDITRILSKTEVFQGLTQTDLEILAQHCEKRTFHKGDTLVKERHPASGFYIIVKGQVEVVLPQQIEGKREQRVSEVKLNILKEGDCFGEYAIVGKMPASASIVALESGDVLRIAKDDFAQVLANTDVLLITEVYAAGEVPISGADGRTLCRAVRGRGRVDPVFVEDVENLPKVLNDLLQPGDLLLTLGAGSIGAVSAHLPETLSQLRAGGNA